MHRRTYAVGARRQGARLLRCLRFGSGRVGRGAVTRRWLRTEIALGLLVMIGATLAPALAHAAVGSAQSRIFSGETTFDPSGDELGSAGAHWTSAPVSASPSPNGTKLLLRTTGGAPQQCYVVNANNSGGLPSVPCLYEASLSPSGDREVYVSSSGVLHTANALTGAEDEAVGTATGQLPVWSPDGKWIAFYSSAGLSIVEPNGANEAVLVPEGGANETKFDGTPPAWLPNSKELAYVVTDSSTPVPTLPPARPEVPPRATCGYEKHGFGPLDSPDVAIVTIDNGAASGARHLNVGYCEYQVSATNVTYKSFEPVDVAASPDGTQLAVAGVVKECNKPDLLVPPEVACGAEGTLTFNSPEVSQTLQGVLGTLPVAGGHPSAMLAKGLPVCRTFGECMLNYSGSTTAPFGAPLAWSGRGTYIALGDSYSSGEGILPYYPGTAVINGDICHRSKKGWPAIVAAKLGYAPFEGAPGIENGFAACSGAVVKDLYQPNHNPANAPTEPAQEQHINIAELEHPHSISLITLTFGGNDVNFGGVVSACEWIGLWHEVAAKVSPETLGALTLLGVGIQGNNGSPRLTPSAAALTTCREWESQPNVEGGSVQSNLIRVPENLVKAYELLLRSAEQAQIYVMGYPDFFPEKDVGPDCAPLLPADVTYFGALIHEFDTKIQGAVEQADASLGSTRLHYVSPEEATSKGTLWTEHTICDSGSYFIKVNTVRLIRNLVIQKLRSMDLTGTLPLLTQFSEPELSNSLFFHPNETGAEVLAAGVLKAVGQTP